MKMPVISAPPAPAETGAGGNGAAPRRRKRNVLLAMGFYTHERHAGIARYAREAHWMLDCRLLAFRASGAHHLQYLSGSRYDGIITYMSLQSPWLCQLVRAARVPVVDLGMDFPGERYPRVLADNLAIGRVGAEHLLERGFTDLLFYSHAYDTHATRRRLEGFQGAVERAGARFHRLIWDDRPRGERGQPRLPWLASKLSALPLPLAVMALNDHVAIEVLEACETAQLRVPERVAVLGVDNDQLVTNLTSVPVSSVDSSRERIGYEAAALLDRLIDGQPKPHEPLLIPPAGVVTRTSTDILAVPDADVAIAIRYIWAHACEPISVNDVAAETSLSRRRMQDLFLRHVGHTISDEIRRRRVDHARRLLAQTQTKVGQIANQSGFGSAERMSKVFKQVVGMTPHAYRERYRHDETPQPT
jgi:LacI family transcriptional regulator